MASLWRKKTKRVLDAACGTGRLSIPLVKMGYEVTGLDITPAMMEVAKQKKGSDKVRFVVGDMCTYKGKKKFDAIVCGSNTLCHLMTDKKAVACLKNFRKNLVRGGTVVFDLWNCEKWGYSLDGRKTVREKGVTVHYTAKDRIDKKANIHQWEDRAKIDDHGEKLELVFAGRLRWRPADKWIKMLEKAGFKHPGVRYVKDKIYVFAKA